MLKLASIKDIPEGTTKTIKIANKSLMVANIGGEYFALDDTCTHAECSLGEMGFMDGGKIICGCHGATFDLKNGQALTLPATVDLKTYPVSVEGGDLYIDIN